MWGGWDKMDKQIYIQKLEELKQECNKIPDTIMGMNIKINSLITLNMRYELIQLNRNLKNHPYTLTKDIIQDSINEIKAKKETLFIEDDNKVFVQKKIKKEEKHKKLWNELWNKYHLNSYINKTERYEYRIKINNLNELIKDKKVLDIGCGQGTFTVAMMKAGAREVTGIDFSEDSIEFADNISKKLNLDKDKIKYITSSVYELPFEDETFDFIIQNGVFHHLENIDKALKEANRILRNEAYFWYYTDGSGGISHILWDYSNEILKNVPIEHIQKVLRMMNISDNKCYHLSDGFKAIYEHSTYKEVIDLLNKYGFKFEKRLKGGFETDMDGEIWEKDEYAKEKFGEGDLRILFKKVK